MKKINLPAILLRGNLLLPYSELRLEFDNDDSKNIIEISEYFHNNLIFIITQKDILEESPKIDEYPKTGTIAKIEHKLELPNGKIRVLIKGVERAYAHSYIKSDDNRIESIIETSSSVVTDSQKEPILMRKLCHEVEEYIKQIPYISNSMLSSLKDAKTLSELTDIISENIPITLERKRLYLEEYDPVSRMEMLLADIYSQKQAYEIEKEMENKVRQNLDRSQKEYLIKEKISILQKELGQNDVKREDIEKIRKQITDKIPEDIRKKLDSEILRYENIPQMSPEIVGVRNYIDTLLQIPWNQYTENNFTLEEIKSKLDHSHYGLSFLKERILEYFLIQKKNLSKKGPILCLVGPPGTGKTSFAHALADVLNKKFVKISVGGIDDTGEIIGHRRTYLGATPGRIIQGLIKAKSMNPIFLIDEIDKMVKSYKGDPASSLLEVLDSFQNDKFIDHYVDEEIDLSQIFFITTANNIDDIPLALKDRLEIIEMKGYTEYEKVEMTQEYLLPKLYREYQIQDEIIFKKEAILKIINEYTKESGVRDLERKLSSIIRKILIKLEKKKKVFVIGEEEVCTYLPNPIIKRNYRKKRGYGVVNALAYLDYTGDVVPVEVTTYKGNNQLILTGSLGDVLKESVMIALSYIKANHRKFRVAVEWLEQKDIHVHIPLGSVSKEGPSAGIAFVTAILSFLHRKKIPENMAFTGEISLTGNVYGIGAFKEKCIGAYKNGIRTVFFSKENEKELEEFPKDLKENMKFIAVENYTEIYDTIFERERIFEKKS